MVNSIHNEDCLEGMKRIASGRVKIGGDKTMDAEKFIIDKVTAALNNVENHSKEELQKVYREAVTYGAKLPPRKRGAFFWRSNLEMLSMIIDALDLAKCRQKQPPKEGAL